MSDLSSVSQLQVLHEVFIHTGSQIRNRKSGNPEIRNPESGNPKSEIRKSEIRNPEIRIGNPEIRKSGKSGNLEPTEK